VHVDAITGDPYATEADTVAIGVFENDPLAGDAPGELEALLESGEAKGSFRHLAVAHVSGRRVILAGLGPRTEFDEERARVVAGLVARRAQELSARTLCWVLPPPEAPEIAAALVTGTLLAVYRFDAYKPSPTPVTLDRLGVAASQDVSSAVAGAVLITTAQNRARDLANRPPNDLTPAALASYAAELAQRFESLSCSALDGDAIRELGMGAFAAVAQGSDQDPRLIVLRYEPARPDAEASRPDAEPSRPDAEPEPRLALVGKAVTFDSGGLWLKPSTSLIDMKFDMAGGAAVIETVAALAESQAPVRVLAVVGATENLISGSAVRPGDIVTALDGTTIEVNNTDAEGRLVLADCITYARLQGCDAIVDVATLTGGVTVALGSTYAGVMANDDALAELVMACARRTGELVWRLPLHPDYADMIKGRYAQLSNRTERRGASASTGAEFLHHFAGDLPWAHLDIAGVSDDVPTPYLGKGGTGWGVRLLTALALSF
jgi:leucyl aminopeptidase